MSVPRLVYDDILNAVSSAVQFGMSAEDFLSEVRRAWKAELSANARAADAVLRRATPAGRRSEGGECGHMNLVAKYVRLSNKRSAPLRRQPHALKASEK